MFLRTLFFALLLYVLYRFLIRKLGGNRSARSNRQKTAFNRRNGQSANQKRRKNLDQIEEAEFEDITEKEKN